MSLAPSSSNFSNQIISTDALPDLQGLPFEKLSPKYLPTHRLVNLCTILVPTLICGLICFQPFFPVPAGLAIFLFVVVSIIVFIGGITTIYCSLADPHKCYALREKDVTYHSGLIFRKTVTQPIIRIQHVELKRGPVERKVGLASLQVFSAGGALHTFEIPGLTLDTAEQIRQYILDHKDTVQNG